MYILKRMRYEYVQLAGNEVAEYIKEGMQDYQNCNLFWRSELLKMILSEPNLNRYDGSHLGEDENTVYFTVGNIFSRGLKYSERAQSMNKKDLDLVHKAMRTNILKMI